MKELILSPEEIYYIGKVSGGKYLDYDYIAAMQDIGKRGKIKAQEILVLKGRDMPRRIS